MKTYQELYDKHKREKKLDTGGSVICMFIREFSTALTERDEEIISLIDHKIKIVDANLLEASNIEMRNYQQAKLNALLDIKQDIEGMP